MSLGYAYIMTHPGERLQNLGIHPMEGRKGLGTLPGEEFKQLVMSN